MYTILFKSVHFLLVIAKCFLGGHFFVDTVYMGLYECGVSEWAVS